MRKIGFEASLICAPQPTGITSFTVSLIQALLNDPEFRQDFKPELLYKLSRFSRRKFRYLPDEATAIWYHTNIIPINKKYDLIHCFGSNFIGWKRPKKIATIYDLAIFQKENKYELYSPSEFRKKRYSELKNIASNSDAIVTISNNTKQDFLEMFRYDESRIHFIGAGIDSRFFNYNNPPEDTKRIKERYNISNPYLLFVGAVSIRKNIVNLVKAYKQSKAFEMYDLILAGPLAYGNDKIIDEIKRSGLEAKVKLLGYIDSADLPPLYAGATAFLFPTYYEGFGIPILESMACRTPVLIGNVGAAPEIAQNHAISCYPHEIESIAKGIKMVLDNTSIDLDAAEKHAQIFNWDRCAKRVVEVYKSLL